MQEAKTREQTDEFLEGIEKDLDNIASELQSYDEYRRLNEMAFSKLLKKHDKKVRNQLKAFWMLKLNKEPFVKNHPGLFCTKNEHLFTVVVDKSLLRLSKCWFQLNQLKNKKQQNKNDSKSEGETKEGSERGKSFLTLPKVPSNKTSKELLPSIGFLQNMLFG